MDNNEKNFQGKTETQGHDNSGVPHINRKFAIVAISVFLSIIMLPTIAWGILKVVGIANPSIMEKVDFDTEENRAMAKFPDKFDPKTVTADIETWYNDNLPFRSVIYTAQDKLNKSIERPYDEKIFPALLKLFHSSADKPDGEDELTGEFLEEIITEETKEPFAETEEETLPTFETEETGDKDCQHVLDNGNIEIEPTCTEYGVIRYSCTLCSYSYREYVKKTAHDYVFTSGTLQNCRADSEAIYTCTACGKTYTKTAKRAHNGKLIESVDASYSDYGYDLYVCDTCGTKYRMNITAKKIDRSEYPIRYSNLAIRGRDNWLFYAGDQSLAYYQGTNLLSEDDMREYTSSIQRLHELCEERGIKLVFMVLPNKEQVYSEHMPTLGVENTYKRTERFVDYIKEHSDANIIFPQAELKGAKPYWRVYYKYDTHWNKAGAFIGTQAMYKALGLETTNLSLCQIKETDRVGANGAIAGDLISIGGIDTTGYEPDIEHIITYKPDVKVTLVAGSDNNGHYYQSTSTVGNDLNFVFIGDSFRVNMLPYITKDFTNCMIANRSYHTNDPAFIEALLNADILVVETVERFDYTLYYTANELINHLEGR